MYGPSIGTGQRGEGSIENQLDTSAHDISHSTTHPGVRARHGYAEGSFQPKSTGVEVENLKNPQAFGGGDVLVRGVPGLGSISNNVTESTKVSSLRRVILQTVPRMQFHYVSDNV